MLFRGTHLFEREGTYRLDLELADLPAQWIVTFRVSPAAPWYAGYLHSISVISLVVGGVFLCILLFSAGARRTRRRLPTAGSGPS